MVQARILKFITSRARIGATADEISERTGIVSQTVSARLFDLRRDGAILRCVDKRPTRNGRKAAVHVIPRFGAALA